MKKYTLIFAAIVLSAGTFTMTGCKKDKDPEPLIQNPSGGNTTNTPAEVKTKISLDATTAKVYFNLTTGAAVDPADINATNWDVSFAAENRNAAIAVNSATEGSGNAGALVLETAFDDVKEAPAEGYLSGTEALPSFMTWANYTGSSSEPNHAVLPKAGLTIVIKTADGKYAKLQILSLYEGNPNTTTAEFANLSTRPAFGYYSFRYAVQTSGSRTF